MTLSSTCGGSGSPSRFMSEGFTAADDASASETYVREIDEEEEIKKMHEKAKQAVQAQAEDLFEDESDDDDILDALAGVEVS